MNALHVSAARSSNGEATHHSALSVVLVAFFMSATGGCVSVHITDRHGQVQTMRQVGILKVEMTTPEQAIVGSISGFGVIGAPLGWSVGYTRQRWALLGNGCHAVVWPPSGAAIDESTRDEIARVAGACLLDDGIPNFQQHSQR